MQKNREPNADLTDSMRLSSGAKSSDLKGRDNHISIPINRLLRIDQTRHRLPRQILLAYFHFNESLTVADS